MSGPYRTPGTSAEAPTDERAMLLAEYQALAASAAGGPNAQRIRERMIEIRSRMSIIDGTFQALTWWRMLTDEQRLELALACCRGCGSLDTSCRCWDDS